jgi:GNAT superfamily N-acetyltransferase
VGMSETIAFEPSQGQGASRVTLKLGKQVVGWAEWSTLAPGVVQLLRIEITAERRRQGYGSMLFRHLLAELDRTEHPRRLVTMIQQKTHLPARAWLTRMGFHHINTLSSLMPDEDIMVYGLGRD